MKAYRHRIVVTNSPSDAVAIDPVAIVGIGCRLPGGADSPQRLWSLLLDRSDTVGEIPEDRWNVDAVYHPDLGRRGKMYTRRGSFLEGVDRSGWVLNRFSCPVHVNDGQGVKMPCLGAAPHRTAAGGAGRGRRVRGAQPRLRPRLGRQRPCPALPSEGVFQRVRGAEVLVGGIWVDFQTSIRRFGS
ncbi:beta-ketoacyl synthase N-terminal-like domain-containing protein [Phytohabitans aurantiacus]